MNIAISLVREWDGQPIGEAVYPNVPEVGTELMFLGREWERYSVVGIRQWPRFDKDTDTGARVTAYVSYSGEIEGEV